MKISDNRHLFRKFLDRFWSSIDRQLAIGCCLLAVALSGCVKYETGINFVGLNYGEIIEHIQLSDRLNSFSQPTVHAWLASIEQRTKQAEGRIDRIGDRELNVIIPFDNTRDLVTKIDRYFNPDLQSTAPNSKLKSHLQIQQNNFFLLVRNHLTYDLDLSSLLGNTGDRQASLSLANSVDLNFSLQSQWSIEVNDLHNNIPSIKSNRDRQVTWQLQPGQVNHLDAVFWLPSWLGIGTVLIILISISGYYFKYRQLPGANLFGNKG